MGSDNKDWEVVRKQVWKWIGMAAGADGIRRRGFDGRDGSKRGSSNG